MKKMQIVFVLDETGSMDYCKQETISAFNEYVEDIKKHDKFDYRFSLLKFNSREIGYVCEKVKLDDIEPLTDQNYRPNNLTPLYDAIGQGITDIGNKKRVLFIIQTDGQENNSREYTQTSVFKLVEKRKKKGWQFVFLGADQDAWLASDAIGIPQASSLSYDSKNIGAALGKMAAASAHYTATASSSDDLFEETDIRDEGNQ